jgi:hypothetical protein
MKNYRGQDTAAGGQIQREEIWLSTGTTVDIGWTPCQGMHETIPRHASSRIRLKRNVTVNDLQLKGSDRCRHTHFTWDATDNSAHLFAKCGILSTPSQWDRKGAVAPNRRLIYEHGLDLGTGCLSCRPNQYKS